jgi:hypothetical protein
MNRKCENQRARGGCNMQHKLGKLEMQTEF